MDKITRRPLKLITVEDSRELMKEGRCILMKNRNMMLRTQVKNLIKSSLKQLEEVQQELEVQLELDLKKQQKITS